MLDFLLEFFFAIFQTNQVLGNLIAGFVLDSNDKNSTQKLAYIFMGTAAFSVFSFFFMRPQPTTATATQTVTNLSFTDNLFRAVILLKQKEILFLLPIYFYSGLEQGFVFGSFTKDIIGRSLGTDKIGFVMSVFGAVNVLGSFGFGKLADMYNTNIVAIIGFIAHSFFFILFFGIMEIEGLNYFEHKDYLIYVGAILCGIGDAAWNTYPGTMTSKLFTNNAEAAFAVFKFHQSLGSFVTFALGAYLTIQVKLSGFFLFMMIALISMVYMNLFVLKKKDGLDIQAPKAVVENMEI